MAQRVLLHGGHVLSMDERVGELTGDVLIEDGTIAAIGPELDVGDAERVDVTGDVVMPGFVDTHRHTWQTPFRGLAADWSYMEYLRCIAVRPNCSAEDVYAGNYVGALEALDAGVTTLLDFSHCTNTPEHADAAIHGLRDAGIRAMSAYGFLASLLPDPTLAELRQRLADARRIRAELSSDDGLITMGIALSECGLLPFEETIAEARSASEMGVPTVMHTGCTWGIRVTQGVPELAHHGLLTPNQIHVHCTALDERDLRRLAEHDCKVSSSPETELQMGMGHPVIGRALALAMRPSLSCDSITANSGDMFAQMRLGLQFERSVRNAVHNAANQIPESLDLTVRDALRWATANGAHAMGIENRVGSLSVGKQADVIVIGGGRVNLMPMADPIGCLVTQANASNVKHVLVGGRFAKRDGELLDVDRARASQLVHGALEAVLRRIGDQGLALLPPAPPGLMDMLNTVASQNLARAWTVA